MRTECNFCNECFPGNYYIGGRFAPLATLVDEDT